MEKVLDIYSRPYDAKHPVVRMDETPRQPSGQDQLAIHHQGCPYKTQTSLSDTFLVMQH